MQASEDRVEDQFASAAGTDGFPAGSSIESVRSRAGIGREHRGAMSGAAQRLAGGLEKSAADAATLKGRIDEERPDRAVARVAGGEAQDLPTFFPDLDARTFLEPCIILISHQGWIVQPVLLHGKADLGDALAFIGTSAANVPGHAASLSLVLAEG